MDYQTIEEAKQAVEVTRTKLWARQNRNHAYVYALNGRFGVLFHPEDRYYATYLPDGAKVLWHAEFKGYPEITVTWEERGNHSQGDFDALSNALGSDIAALLLGLNGEDE